MIPEEQALADLAAEIARLDEAERKALELLRDPQMPTASIQEELREIQRERIDLENSRDRIARKEAGHRAELEELRDILSGEAEAGWPQPAGSSSDNPVSEVIAPFRTIALWLELSVEERQLFLGRILNRVRAYKETGTAGTLSLDFSAGFGIGASTSSAETGIPTALPQ